MKHIGNKKMKCSNCSKQLTKDNSSKSVFNRKRGFCLECNAQYHLNHYRKNRKAILAARSAIHRKHARIRLLLKKRACFENRFIMESKFLYRINSRPGMPLLQGVAERYGWRFRCHAE